MRLQTYRPFLDRLVFGLAVLGILTSAHLHIQQSRGFDQGCFGFSAPQQVEATFDCNVVTQSDASTIFGVSNSIWGLLFYLAVAVLTVAAAFDWFGRRSAYKLTRMSVIGVGFIYSIYLVYYQFFELGELCALCLTSAGITTLLFVVQAVDFTRPHPPKTASTEDMPARSKREVAYMGGLVLLAAVLIGADFAYFKSLESPDPFTTATEQDARRVSDEASASPVGSLPDECRYDPERGPVEDYQALVNFFDPSKGTPNAAVTIIEYFDPNCPHCRTLQPVMEEVIETHEDEAHFVFKPFVLWQHSIAQSEALYAAAQEGKFFEMLEHQYAMQNPSSGLTPNQLREIAAEIGMDPDVLMQRIESGIYRRTLAQEKKAAIDVGVNSTPTILINGRFVETESRTVDCLRQMIDQAAQG